MKEGRKRKKETNWTKHLQTDTKPTKRKKKALSPAKRAKRAKREKNTENLQKAALSRIRWTDLEIRPMENYFSASFAAVSFLLEEK